MSNQCQFEIDWAGRCRETTEGSFCAKHAAMKCVSCEAQAVESCDYTGQFVCGAPLCAACEGWNDATQTFGTWGFTNHRHRRKEGAPNG